MISNRQNKPALTAFFQAIKSRLPHDEDYHASHVMTDDANQYHNAWVSVFGTADKKGGAENARVDNVGVDKSAR